MSLENIEALMKEVGPLIEQIESVDQLEGNEWEVVIEGGLGLVVSYSEDARKLTFSTNLGMPDADARIASEGVKAGLRRNTDEAIERGLFGVPTFVLGDDLFWGFDAIDFLLDALDDPQWLSSPSMRAVSSNSGATKWVRWAWGSAAANSASKVSTWISAVCSSAICMDRIRPGAGFSRKS